MARLQFCGAAGCVTGACMRLTTDQASVLIDCGMFQGSKTLKALNYGPFPFDVAELDAVGKRLDRVRTVTEKIPVEQRAEAVVRVATHARRVAARRAVRRVAHRTVDRVAKQPRSGELDDERHDEQRETTRECHAIGAHERPQPRQEAEVDRPRRQIVVVVVAHVGPPSSAEASLWRRQAAA